MKANKILMTLLMGMFLISLASASIYYNEGEQTYTIDTWVPNWLGGDGESVVTLIDNTNKCLIDCSFTLEGYNEKPVNLIDEIAFINRAGQDVSQYLKSIQFELGTYQDVEVEVPIYEEVCVDVQENNETNQTNEYCSEVQTGTETTTENQFVWQEYTGQEVDGYYKLKANAKKDKVSMDWIVTFRGEDLNEWAWWDTDWGLKREITITENSANTLNNYTTLLYVTYDSDMKTDFSDLRFLDTTETIELGYWIENKTDSSHAYIWVQVPTLTASSNTSIYMYYDNSGASSNSDPEDAFWYYLDTTTFYTRTGPSSNFLVIDNQSVNIWDEWKFKIAKVNSKRSSSSYSTYHYIVFNSGDGSDFNAGVNEGLRFGNLDCSGDYSWYDSWGACRLGSGSAGTYYEFEGNNIKPASYDFTSGTQTISYGLRSDNGGNTASTNLREFILMGYASSEPTYSIGDEKSANNFFINIVSPVDYYNSSSQDVLFECNATDETGIYSLNLTINGSVYHTETGAGNTNLTLSSTETLADGFWEWYCTGNDDLETKNSSTRYLTIDSTQPNMVLHSPTGNETTDTLPHNITLNVTSSDTHLDSCWYWTNENATNQTYTCNTNQNISFANEGEYIIYYCANDSLGNENCDFVSKTIFYYTYSQPSTASSVGEGDSVTFVLFVNMTNIPETNAVFNINGTEYSEVAKYDLTNYTKFSKTINVPDGWGNLTGSFIDWYWTFNISGVSVENTTTQQLRVYEVAIDDCSAYGTQILNYTLFDEETKSHSLPTPLANQTIEVDVLIESYENSSLSWNYSKKETGVNSMDICVPNGLLNFTEYNLGVVTRYKADDHVVEFNYIDNFNLTISNIPQIKNLYDLYTGTERSEYSTSFLINYQDEYYLPVESAIIDLLRYYVEDGEYISVENAQTDIDGNTRLHLVTEDVRYKAIVRYDGNVVYTSPTFLALCQATPCQINFQKQNDVTPTNQTTIDNLNYQVTLDQDTRIVEMTYSTSDGSSVNVQMNVTKWDAYSNDTICTDSATSSGGTLSCEVPLTATNSTYLVQIARNSESLPTYTFDLNPSPYDTFGYTGVLLTGLLFLTLVLMTISSGPIAVVVFGLLGIIFAGMLNLFSGGSIIGVGASLMWLIVAGVIIIIKASNRRSGG